MKIQLTMFHPKILHRISPMPPISIHPKADAAAFGTERKSFENPQKGVGIAPIIYYGSPRSEGVQGEL